MTRLSSLIIVLCLSGLVCAAPAPVQAQLRGQPAGNLPPALAAAVLSGNPNAVAQAIRVLSGGNPAQAANLAAAVIAFVEKQQPANPGGGAAALGALAVLQDKAVFNAAPAQVQQALAGADRIAANPDAPPDAAAKLAAEALRVKAQFGLVAAEPAPVPPVNDGGNGKDAPQDPAVDVVVEQVIDQAADRAAAQAIGDVVEQVINQDMAPAMNPAPCSGSAC